MGGDPGGCRDASPPIFGQRGWILFHPPKYLRFDKQSGTKIVLFQVGRRSRGMQGNRGCIPEKLSWGCNNINVNNIFVRLVGIYKYFSQGQN
jgi:hypothetical protein